MALLRGQQSGRHAVGLHSVHVLLWQRRRRYDVLEHLEEAALSAYVQHRRGLRVGLDLCTVLYEELEDLEVTVVGGHEHRIDAGLVSQVNVETFVGHHELDYVDVSDGAREHQRRDTVLRNPEVEIDMMLLALSAPAENSQLKVLVDGTLELGQLLRRNLYFLFLFREHLVFVLLAVFLIRVHVR